MSDWIKCSERMPEVTGEYLAYTDRSIMDTRHYRIDFGWLLDYHGGNVTHWQPLPEPPTQLPEGDGGLTALNSVESWRKFAELNGARFSTPEELDSI